MVEGGKGCPFTEEDWLASLCGDLSERIVRAMPGTLGG